MSAIPSPPSIQELLELIRKRPGFYTVERSIFRLDSFLSGYELGVRQSGLVLQGVDDLARFRDWLALRLGFSSSTSGAANMIRDKSASDADAFDRFFALWDEFKRV
jgi:hypothetical protein